MIAAAWLRPNRWSNGSSLLGAALTGASFAFMGHTAASAERWLLAPLLILHLLAIAFWFGALLPLEAAARIENQRTAAAIIERFSEIAIRVVPCVLIAGIAMAAVLLPGPSGLATPYGFSLIAKLAGFSVLMALAALNRLRLAPRISSGDGLALSALRASILAEWILIFAVICVSAVMTALFSPDH